MFGARFTYFVSLFSLLFLLVNPFGATAQETPFPIPGEMELQVQFWVNVFTRYSIQQQVIHDSDRPERIYSLIDFRKLYPTGRISRQKKEMIVRQEKDRIASILKHLASSQIDLQQCSAEEQRIIRLFGRNPGSQAFQRAALRIRAQGGMKEAFRDGIVRSGLYLDAIRNIFKELEVPEELIYLPHVESSYYPHACSKYNAVGLWQFTKATGNQFLVISEEIDERRDPFLSSVAAAKLLQANYKSLKSWPLAVMAYNHGLSGISRATRRLDTTDPVKIIQNYSSRRFGFASRNFYAEFLAAVQVAQSYELYFGKLILDDPLRFRTQILLTHQDLNAIRKKYRISDEQLRDLNPALRSPVFRGEKPVPGDYPLRLPKRPLDFNSRSFTMDERKVTRIQFHLPFNPEKTAAVVFDKLKRKGWIPDLKKKEQASPLLNPDRHEKIESMDTTLFSWADANQRLSLSGNTLVVQPEETLGHYADWLEIPTQILRRINGLKYGQAIHVGQRLYLSFQKVTRESFFQRRMAYHRTIRESFFNRHAVQGTSLHQVRQGETLWTVMLNQSHVPLWLLAACNEGKDLNRIHPGQTLVIPRITKVESGASQ